MIKRTGLGALLTLFITATTAVAQQPIQQIDSMRAIPGTQMQMVQAGDKTYYVSPNGRFVLRGTLYDMWSGGEKIESVSQLGEKASRINLSQMKLDLDDLTDLSLGTGPKEVALFVSPGCGYCKSVMNQITGQMKKDYTFKVIPLPILGESSQKHTRLVTCAAQKDPAGAVKALMSENYQGLSEETCALDKVARATMTSKLLDITGVPFLIAPDGRVQSGAPKNLQRFLEGDI